MHCVLLHPKPGNPHVYQQPARQGGTASWCPARDAAMGFQYLHCLDLREVACRNLVFSLQLNVDFWQSADKLSLFVFLPKYTRHLFLQVADDVGMYLKRCMSVRTCHLGLCQKDKHNGILSASQHITGTSRSHGPWDSRERLWGMRGKLQA